MDSQKNKNLENFIKYFYLGSIFTGGDISNEGNFISNVLLWRRFIFILKFFFSDSVHFIYSHNEE